VSVVALLLNASGIELVIKRDLDLNRELRAVGISNLLGGLVGGSVSYHALADTVLNYRAGRGGRVAVWATAAFAALALFFGAAALAYIPKLVLGTLLVFLGFSFLYEWVYQARDKFPRLEYAVIWLILIVVAAVGYLQGVGVGLLAAIGLFVLNYSRVNVVKRALSGAEYQSRVTRRLVHRRTLLAHGEEIYILQLQGYVFFGTANRLLEQVRLRLSQPGATSPRFVALDFAQVTGLDSTALLRFAKIKQIADDASVILLVTGASAGIRRQLEKGGFLPEAAGGARAFADLDHGVEWCEDQLLAQAGMQPGETDPGLQAQFQALVPGAGSLDNLFRYLERHQVETGACLMCQGNAPDYIYFIESGQVTARLEQTTQAPVRLETMRGGHVLGEIGFYLGNERTATVVADEPSVVYSLSAAALQKMEQQDPEAASTFHKIVVHLMAERSAHLIRAVNALQR
jgi:SulP family sulfate permease